MKIKWNGKEMTLIQFCRENNLNYSTTCCRYRNGWTLEELYRNENKEKYHKNKLKNNNSFKVFEDLKDNIDILDPSLILIMRYRFDKKYPHTLEETGIKFGMSRQAIHQKIEKGLNKLKKYK